jgi:hypothetical protein
MRTIVTWRGGGDILQRISLLAVALLSTGCSPSPSQFPRNYVECLEKVTLETKHQVALALALDHCKKLDPKGELSYNGWESIPGGAVKK